MKVDEAKIRAHFKELFKDMVEQKTGMMMDAKGQVWCFGKWYGEKPHFRCNFGHWSEEVLQDWMIPSRMPFTAYVPEKTPSKETMEWTDFYLHSRPLEKDDLECPPSDSSALAAEKKPKS